MADILACFHGAKPQGAYLFILLVVRMPALRKALYSTPFLLPYCSLKWSMTKYWIIAINLQSPWTVEIPFIISAVLLVSAVNPSHPGQGFQPFFFFFLKTKVQKRGPFSF